MVKIGAAIQPTALVRVTPLTTPALEIVAVARGRVVHTHPVTVTRGADV